MWMRLIQRLSNIFKAKANDTLDKVEDPVQMIKLAVVELEEAIKKASKATAVAMANQKKLEKDYEQFRLESVGWYQKASAALESGNEELAQKALGQKSISDKKTTEYELLSKNSKYVVDQLTDQLDDYKLKLEEARAKESIYSAKAESAKAQKQIAESLGGLDGSALANMSKYEQKINQLEAEAESLTQMNSEQGKVEKEFKNFEKNISIQSDLEKLRIELEQKKELANQKKLSDIENKFKELNSTSNTISLPQQNTPLQISESKTEKQIDNFFNKNK